MADGTWVWVPGKKNKGEGSFFSGLLFLLFLAVLSFLYNLICPDYSYTATQYDDYKSAYCEYFVYEKWLFSEEVSGEIIFPGGPAYAVDRINFEGRLNDDILIIELDSMGAIWNNGPTLEVKIIGDTLLQYRDREMVGGKCWFNFPSKWHWKYSRLNVEYNPL